MSTCRGLAAPLLAPQTALRDAAPTALLSGCGRFGSATCWRPPPSQAAENGEARSGLRAASLQQPLHLTTPPPARKKTVSWQVEFCSDVGAWLPEGVTPGRWAALAWEDVGGGGRVSVHVQRSERRKESGRRWEIGSPQVARGRTTPSRWTINAAIKAAAKNLMIRKKTPATLCSRTAAPRGDPAGRPAPGQAQGVPARRRRPRRPNSRSSGRHQLQEAPATPRLGRCPPGTPAHHSRWLAAIVCTPVSPAVCAGTGTGVGGGDGGRGRPVWAAAPVLTSWLLLLIRSPAPAPAPRVPPWAKPPALLS